MKVVFTSSFDLQICALNPSSPPSPRRTNPLRWITAASLLASHCFLALLLRCYCRKLLCYEDKEWHCRLSTIALLLLLLPLLGAMVGQEGACDPFSYLWWNSLSALPTRLLNGALFLFFVCLCSSSSPVRCMMTATHYTPCSSPLHLPQLCGAQRQGKDDVKSNICRYSKFQKHDSSARPHDSNISLFLSIAAMEIFLWNYFLQPFLDLSHWSWPSCSKTFSSFFFYRILRPTPDPMASLVPAIEPKMTALTHLQTKHKPGHQACKIYAWSFASHHEIYKLHAL